MFWFGLADRILESHICASEFFRENHRCVEYEQFNFIVN
jgi:hypothetical protein